VARRTSSSPSCAAEGATEEELALLAQTAREVGRLDATFRPYLPSVVSERIRRRGTTARPALGEERVITVMFADLSGFTPYSEGHEPREVVEMLNAYWAEVVPVIDRAGGTIEHFAGDGVLTLFNASGDQPDHVARAVRAARDVLEVTRPLAVAHPDWPVFRLGINTVPAVVGVVGTDARRSFAAIGDPVNTGSRLMTVAQAGEIVVGATTWAILADRRPASRSDRSGSRASASRSRRGGFGCPTGRAGPDHRGRPCAEVATRRRA
jgi:class 3 adenylate cyclase